LADLSHDLRTPLSAIIGFSELLGSGTVSAESAKRRKFLGHIAAAGRNVLQLINEILDLANIEAGSFEFRPERVNLGDVVREAVNAVPTGTRGRAHVGFDIDPALTSLLLDPARLKQVLRHYVTNAVHLAAEGTRVTVRGLLQGTSHLCLEIEALETSSKMVSAGPVDAELKMAPPCSNFTLELCRSLIEAQGGTVKMRHEPGTGCFIQIILNSAHCTDNRGFATIHEPTADPNGPRLLVHSKC